MTWGWGWGLGALGEGKPSGAQTHPHQAEPLAVRVRARVDPKVHVGMGMPNLKERQCRYLSMAMSHIQKRRDGDHRRILGTHCRSSSCSSSVGNKCPAQSPRPADRCSVSTMSSPTCGASMPPRTRGLNLNSRWWRCLQVPRDPFNCS